MYLDFNAPRPLALGLVANMTACLTEDFGKPSSTHWAGTAARDAVEAARLKVAMLVGCHPTEVVFTSEGTAQVTYLPVDRYGRIDPDDLGLAIRLETVPLWWMHANNEVGTLEPIPGRAATARERAVLSHTHAGQTIGKIPVDVEPPGGDLLSPAGHKLCALTCGGTLYVCEGVALEPLLHGGPQEAGWRPGSESALLIGGLGAGCETAQQWVHDDRIGDLTAQFWRLLRERSGNRAVLNGHPTERLPHTLNAGFLGYQGEDVLGRLGGVAVPTGSTCHAGREEMTPVLRAMDGDETTGFGALRFSLGRNTILAEVERVIEWLTETVR